MARSKTILIVDDEPEVLSAYGRLLERMVDHAKVVTAGSAIDGLKLIRGTKVDLILADYRMPEMDGIEFLAQARMLNPRIRRVIFTAYAEPELSRRAAVEALVDDFVSKDVEPAELVKRIRRMLDV